MHSSYELHLQYSFRISPYHCYDVVENQVSLHISGLMDEEYISFKIKMLLKDIYKKVSFK